MRGVINLNANLDCRIKANRFHFATAASETHSRSAHARLEAGKLLVFARS